MTTPLSTTPRPATSHSTAISTTAQSAWRAVPSHNRHPQPRVTELSVPKQFHFKRHDKLHFQSCGFWRLQSGYVRTLSWTPEGEPVPLGFWTTGDTVGFAIAQADPYEAECLSTVKAEYLGSSYVFSRETVLTQVRQSHDLLRIAHCRQAETRLLHFVCWLARRFGTPTAQGRMIKIRLTHQEIADSIGITRVTVTRLIKVLEQEHKIKWTTQTKMVYRPTYQAVCGYLYGEANVG